MSVQEILKQLTAWASAYWHAATDPLGHFTWQTASLFALIILAALLIAWLLLRYSWMFSKPALAKAVIKRVPHTFKDHLRMSPPNYLTFHRLAPTLSLEADLAGQKIVKEDSSRYYLITVVEHGKRRPILYKEMRLHAATRRGRADHGTVQFDAETLTHIRVNNGYEEDDHPEADIFGEYNIYIRAVRWYDLRHWLMHPNREIRLVVWVSTATTVLPLLIDLLIK